MIGKSVLPPYYALGVYQGSNSYNTLTKVNKVLKSYGDSGIAVEGLFLDNYNEQPH